MARSYYFLAVVALLSIPALCIPGAMLANAINPEIAAGHADYVRNFQLLTLAKRSIIQGTGLLACGLWLTCCFFLLKAKARSCWWLPLAILGPFGLAALIMLRDQTSGDLDMYQRFVGGMRPFVRTAYEIAVFVVVWMVAEEAVWLWRDLMIFQESVRTGVPVDTIIDEQNASGGMWAFSEGLEAMFLVALAYVLRPVCFNAAGLIGKFPSSRRA